MNVLLVSPSYSQTFWSFENVLKLTGKKCLLPPVGLITVAALLPQSWNFKLKDLTFQTISEEDWNWCDVVMVSGMAVQHVGILHSIRQAKARDKTVVVGGPWAFHFPQEALAAGASLVVVGEAEPVILEVVESIQNRVSGKIIRATQFADMERSPAPRFDLLDVHAYVDMGLQFSRGCPFKCEFCDVTLMLGHKVRTKTPEQVLDELQALYDLGWRRTVFFVDDNFIGNVAKAKRLLKELLPWSAARGKPFEFYTQASVNLASETEALELMSRCDFCRVFLGIETPDEDSLRQSGKSQNVGKDLDEVCRKVNEAGIEVIAGCIIGFDHEAPGADRRLIDFAVRNQVPEMFVTLLQVGPGTDLWLRMEREGRLLSYDYENLSNQTGLINFRPTRPMAQIVEEFINVYGTLYEMDNFLDRAVNHLLSMKPKPEPKPFQRPYFYEIKCMLTILIRQGILYPSRWKFWKGLFTLAMRQPERLPKLFTYCVLAEHYTEFRRTIGNLLREQLARVEEPGTPLVSVKEYPSRQEREIFEEPSHQGRGKLKRASR